MSYLNIKYFPTNINFYLFAILINLFFILVFTANIFWITTELTKDFDNSKILLIIPKSLKDQEEKRDLIFNQLSLENQILSVEEEDGKKVKVLLERILENTTIKDTIIPEVYNLVVKNKKKINLESLNNKISKIVLSARVFSTYDNPKAYLTKPYTLLYFLIAIFVITNYFFINNIIYKINNYLSISIALGIKDLIIFKNLNIGFFFIIFMSFILCYIIYFLLIDGGKNNFLVFDKSLYMYISICLSYYLFFLLNFNLQLYSFLKKKL
jgi:hypothetical protein